MVVRRDGRRGRLKIRDDDQPAGGAEAARRAGRGAHARPAREHASWRGRRRQRDGLRHYRGGRRQVAISEVVERVGIDLR